MPPALATAAASPLREIPTPIPPWMIGNFTFSEPIWRAGKVDPHSLNIYYSRCPTIRLTARLLVSLHLLYSLHLAHTLLQDSGIKPGPPKNETYEKPGEHQVVEGRVRSMGPEARDGLFRGRSSSRRLRREAPHLAKQTMTMRTFHLALIGRHSRRWPSLQRWPSRPWHSCPRPRPGLRIIFPPPLGLPQSLLPLARGRSGLR